MTRLVHLDQLLIVYNGHHTLTLHLCTPELENYNSCYHNYHYGNTKTINAKQVAMNTINTCGWRSAASLGLSWVDD